MTAAKKEDKTGNTKVKRSFIDDGCPNLGDFPQKFRKHVASDCHKEAPQACC